MIKKILQSSYDAIMTGSCPVGHEDIGYPCTRNGSVLGEIVCPERRSQVTITHPKKMVKVDIRPNQLVKKVK